jgi:hypothetical protein
LESIELALASTTPSKNMSLHNDAAPRNFFGVPIARDLGAS